MANKKLTGGGLSHVPFPEGGGRGRPGQRFGEGIESLVPFLHLHFYAERRGALAVDAHLRRTGM